MELHRGDQHVEVLELEPRSQPGQGCRDRQPQRDVAQCSAELATERINGLVGAQLEGTLEPAAGPHGSCNQKESIRELLLKLAPSPGSQDPEHAEWHQDTQDKPDRRGRRVGRDRSHEEASHGRGERDDRRPLCETDLDT